MLIKDNNMIHKLNKKINITYNCPTFRIIPRLDVKGENLVKGIHLEGLRVMGDPAIFAEHYYKEGADEIFYQDVVASLYERNSLSNVIQKTASKISIPITVSGGIRNIEDINRVLKSGADKVSINTAAIKNPNFINQSVNKFGSSTISICIEAIKNTDDGEYYCFTDNGRNRTGIKTIDWITEVQNRGAGEIIITSVDKEGTASSFDQDLLDQIYKLVKIPLIVHGGIGGAEDVLKLKGKAEGACIASIFHYDTISKIKTINNITKEGNFRFINEGTLPKRITPISVKELKNTLTNQGILIRN